MPLTLPHLPQPMKVWEKIGLVVGEEPEYGRYVSRVEDFQPDCIVISPPEFVDGTLRLREGSEVDVYLTRDDAVYKMPSVITQQKRDGRTFFVLTIPTSVTRVQRRQFVRIDVRERIDYAILGDGWELRSPGQEFEWHRSICENLSGGGILLQTESLLKVGGCLLLYIPLFERIGVSGTIAAICRRVTTRERQSLAGIEFLTKTHLRNHFSDSELKRFPEETLNFDRISQNKLINYVFQRQIDLRKKGLL